MSTYADQPDHVLRTALKPEASRTALCLPRVYLFGRPARFLEHPALIYVLFNNDT